MYDGSTGAAEAMMMAVRVTGRDRAVVARTVHPEYREVLTTYAQHQEIPIAEVGYVPNGHPASGRIDMAALNAAITAETACVLIQSPNFFGTIEDVAAIAELAHARGALLIVSIAEAVSLGIVRPPAEADIVSLEAQSFGVAMSYGGPYCGVLACKEKFLRQMPGRLVGETRDVNGKRGFVLTLSTREQHIRREKATSNICTNQALVAMMVTIFLTVYGKEGLRELAEHNLAKAAYLRSVLAPQGSRHPDPERSEGEGPLYSPPGAANSSNNATASPTLLFSGAPRFHEFVLDLPAPAEEINAALLDRKIVGGLSLFKWYPELGPNATLWCATEITTRTQMDAAASALRTATPAAELARA
jgi:glycine dehydrogenase subunit 1